MPIAGRGSRFHRDGIVQPKPLIDLFGRPFFWWAVESLRRVVPVRELVFVVLREHIRHFGIDDRIRAYYPEAVIVDLPDVTSGAAETAALGAGALRGRSPIAVNDCDHAFAAPSLPSLLPHLCGEAAGALLGFRATSPAYSYAALDAQGDVSGTVEKQAVSPFAIAGCYLFSGGDVFLQHYDSYRRDCPYDELFVSGIYNAMIAAGQRVLFQELGAHVSFGTPAELAGATRDRLGFMAGEQV